MSDTPLSFRITNATLVLPDRLVPNGSLEVSRGRLAAVGPEQDLPSWSGRTIDAGGDFVTAGYIDLHVHGGDNADFMDGTLEAFETVVRAHTRHGTTTIVPTSTVARHEQTIAFLENTRVLQHRGADPRAGLSRTLGAHLYGPYFAEEKAGCDDAIERAALDELHRQEGDAVAPFSETLAVPARAPRRAAACVDDLLKAAVAAERRQHRIVRGYASMHV